MQYCKKVELIPSRLRSTKNNCIQTEMHNLLQACKQMYEYVMMRVIEDIGCVSNEREMLIDICSVLYANCDSIMAV